MPGRGKAGGVRGSRRPAGRMWVGELVSPPSITSSRYEAMYRPGWRLHRATTPHHPYVCVPSQHSQPLTTHYSTLQLQHNTSLQQNTKSQCQQNNGFMPHQTRLHQTASITSSPPPSRLPRTLPDCPFN